MGDKPGFKFTSSPPSRKSGHLEVTMRRFWMIPLALLAVSLTACGSRAESPITPAPDRPTFLFFYTDG